MTKTELLREIKEEVVGLKNSPLYKERVKNKAFPVIGEGDHDADVVFIGEAPGAREAATGRPFCGSAGEILDECLKEEGIRREKTYVTNILKDRPPNNRDPLPEEVEIYFPFLNRQISIIQPKIIVCLGRFSMEYMFRKFGLENEIKPISTLHGKPVDAQAEHGKIKILPLFHPAVAVYNREKKKDLISGFKVLRNLIEKDDCRGL